MYKSGYRLYESKFNEIKENSFDVIPEDLLEDNEDELPQEPTNQEVPEPPTGDNNEQPNDNVDMSVEPEPVNNELPQTEEPVQDEAGVDDLQNEIIKLNTVALNNLNQKLNDLKDITIEITNKINSLSAEVEEVREPDTEEKLMSKKQVSFPYYANLNDYWTNNWFEQQKEENNINVETRERGIRKVNNNEYVADFDDLPSTNSLELKDSFNDYV